MLFRSVAVGSCGLEGALESLLAGSGQGLNDRESDFGVSELDGFGSSDIRGLLENGGSNDVDGAWVGSVVSAHFLVKLRNGSVQGDVSELLVHVMESGSGLHAQHDSVGFHVSGVLLVDVVDSENLSVGSLQFVQSSHLKPETGLGDDLILSENSHRKDLGLRLLFGGQSSAENQKLLNIHLEG